MKFFISNAPALLSYPYCIFMRLRRRLYRRGILHSFKSALPVISVGNILMGGTGKTPHVDFLTRHFMRQGLQPAIITRGYKGGIGKGPLSIIEGCRVKYPPTLTGDEPFMLASSLMHYAHQYSLPAPFVIVGSDRVSSARAADGLGADIIILDDGFQHMAIKRDIDIVLFPFNISKRELYPWPKVLLREEIASIEDADIVLITKTPFNVSNSEIIEKKQWILPYLKQRQAVLFSSFKPQDYLFDIYGREIALSEFKKWPCLAFCGIADPDAFKDMLSDVNIMLKGLLSFKDHHNYSLSDIKAIKDRANALGVKALITTEKDIVKIRHLIYSNGEELIKGIEIYYMKIRVSMEDREVKAMFSILKEKLKEMALYG